MAANIIKRYFKNRILPKLRWLTLKHRIARIQSMVRMKIQRRKYLLDLEEDKKVKKLQTAARVKEAVLFRMKAKEAAKVIERCRYRILHLRELR